LCATRSPVASLHAPRAQARVRAYIPRTHAAAHLASLLLLHELLRLLRGQVDDLVLLSVLETRKV